MWCLCGEWHGSGGVYGGCGVCGVCGEWLGSGGVYGGGDVCGVCVVSVVG